eukprot:m.639390 g.639390  ORF g.639390 m.639390 type:complete len:370 (+) comp22615_c0_seq2:507-1616(+)
MHPGYMGATCNGAHASVLSDVLPPQLFCHGEQVVVREAGTGGGAGGGACRLTSVQGTIVGVRTPLRCLGPRCRGVDDRAASTTDGPMAAAGPRSRCRCVLRQRHERITAAGGLAVVVVVVLATAADNDNIRIGACLCRTLGAEALGECQRRVVGCICFGATGYPATASWAFIVVSSLLGIRCEAGRRCVVLANQTIGSFLALLVSRFPRGDSLGRCRLCSSRSWRMVQGVTVKDYGSTSLARRPQPSHEHTPQRIVRRLLLIPRQRDPDTHTHVYIHNNSVLLSLKRKENVHKRRRIKYAQTVHPPLQSEHRAESTMAAVNEYTMVPKSTNWQSNTRRTVCIIDNPLLKTTGLSIMHSVLVGAMCTDER